MSPFHRSIAICAALLAAFGGIEACTSGGSGGGSKTDWLSCAVDADCPSPQRCVAKRCGTAEAGSALDASSAGGAPSGGTSGSGGTATGGSATGAGGTDAGSRPGTGGIGSGSSSGGADASIHLGASTEAGASDARVRDATAWSCATGGGSWHPAESMGGAGYSDKGPFGDAPRTVAVAPDGSAFAAWVAHDPTSTHDYVYASRYTPAGGWASYRFDEYAANGAYGGVTPEVAVSDDGEALFVFRDAIATDGSISYVLRSMRYSNGWQAPEVIEGPQTGSAPVSFVVGADAHGDFVAAWLEWIETKSTTDPTARMARYTKGSGWGPVVGAMPGSDGGSRPGALGVSVAVEGGGRALVAWAEGANYKGPAGIAVERFDPSSGWSGKEQLAADLPAAGVSAPSAAISTDGSAAVIWTQGETATWIGLDPPLLAVARTFDGAWSAPTNLTAVTDGSLSAGYASVATDSAGAYIAAWTERNAGTASFGLRAFASRRTGGGAWSPKVRIDGLGTADGGPSPFQIQRCRIGMGPTGDAVVALTEFDRWGLINPLDVATFSPSAGWTPTTRLSTNAALEARALMDACGNATVTWGAIDTHDVQAARRQRGGVWVFPSSIGTTNGNFGNGVGAGVGASGEVVTMFRSADDHDVMSAVLR